MKVHSENTPCSRVGVMLGVTEIKTFFRELASQEWEFGMRVVVAEKVGAQFGSICHHLQESRWQFTFTFLLMLFPDYIFFFFKKNFFLMFISPLSQSINTWR